MWLALNAEHEVEMVDELGFDEVEKEGMSEAEIKRCKRVQGFEIIKNDEKLEKRSRKDYK